MFFYLLLAFRSAALPCSIYTFRIDTHRIIEPDALMMRGLIVDDVLVAAFLNRIRTCADEDRPGHLR